MANPNNSIESVPFSFSNFPEDVQLCIISFLNPSDISSFACTSKRFLSLCRDDAKVWFSICDRRWGSKTQIRKWGSGKITFKHLHKTLAEYENLIGFWRRSGEGSKNTTLNSIPPLVFFEWGPSFITGSRVSPSSSGNYCVIKAPFLLMGISPKGENISLLDPDFKLELNENLVDNAELGLLENELIPVNVSHMGKCHVVVEENVSFGYSNSPDGRKIGLSGISRTSSSSNLTEDMVGLEIGSPPDRLTSEIYQYFANRTSPGGERSWRRQRRREKERQGRRKWESEHFVKIVHCSPTPSRPLQGLWKVMIIVESKCNDGYISLRQQEQSQKRTLEHMQQFNGTISDFTRSISGICEDMNLDFYLVAYDDIGGIACRRVGDSAKPFASYAPVFWTSNPTFIDSPLSPEEAYIFDSREHLRPPSLFSSPETDQVSRILYINSSYDLVIPELVGSTANPRQVEGRIWQYDDGTFGFGFLRDNYILDLKHIAVKGSLLDAHK